MDVLGFSQPYCFESGSPCIGSEDPKIGFGRRSPCWKVLWIGSYIFFKPDTLTPKPRTLNPKSSTSCATPRVGTVVSILRRDPVESPWIYCADPGSHWPQIQRNPQTWEPPTLESSRCMVYDLGIFVYNFVCLEFRFLV